MLNKRVLSIAIVSILLLSAGMILTAAGESNELETTSDDLDISIGGEAPFMLSDYFDNIEDLGEPTYGVENFPEDASTGTPEMRKYLEGFGNVGLTSYRPAAPPNTVMEEPKAKSTHVEYDSYGPNYNNNITSAERIDFSTSYDTDDGGNSPSVDFRWTSDGVQTNNPLFRHYYNDTDYYWFPMLETNSQHDFVNITFQADYGSDMGGGDRSNKDYGINVKLIYEVWDEDDQDWMYFVQKERNNFYGNRLYMGQDTWTDPYGMAVTCMHFCPATSGRWYLGIEPINITDNRGNGVDKVWYNLSLSANTVKTAGNVDTVKADVNPDFVCGVPDPATGANPARDFNQNRDNGTARLTTDTYPLTNQFVNEMHDAADWYNFSADPKISEYAGKQMEVNITYEIYEDPFFGWQLSATDFIVFTSMTYVTAVQYNGETYWQRTRQGNNVMNWVDQNDQDIDDQFRNPWANITTNTTTEGIWTSVSNNAFVRARIGGQDWFGPAWNAFLLDDYHGMDIYDVWTYYNMTDADIGRYYVATPPILTGGAVTPTSGTSDDTYYYNVTYYDINDHGPESISIDLGDSILRPMTLNTSSPLADDDFTNGEEYVFVWDQFSPTIQDQDQQFTFFCFDLILSVKADGVHGSVFNGPHIDNNEPPIWQVGYDDPISVDEDEANDGYFYFNLSSRVTDLKTPLDLQLTISETPDGPWLNLFESDLFDIDASGNMSVGVKTMENKNGQKSFYFNATDPQGMYSVSPNPIPIEVRPTNDAPVISKLVLDGTDHTVVDGEVSIVVFEDEMFNLTIHGSDIDGGSTALTFSLDNPGTSYELLGIDIPSTALDAHNFTGEFSFTPTNDEVGYLLMNLTCADQAGTDSVLVNITVENTQDGPDLKPFTLAAVVQYGYRNKTLTATDPDTNVPGSAEDLTFSCNLSDSIPYVEKGEDWDLNAKTGVFWFHPVDQRIIGFGPDIDKATYDVQFKVTDKSGLFSVQNVKIVVKDLPEAPVPPEDFEVIFSDYNPDYAGNQGLDIQVVAPEFEDPDGSDITIEWDFGDFRPYQRGQTVNYSYNDEGNYTIRMIYSDGDFVGEVIKDITLYPVIITPIPEPGVVETDEDGDGLDDKWEVRFFGSLLEDADGDYDNDGYTNLDEFNIGSDPTDDEDPGDDPPEPKPPEEPGQEEEEKTFWEKYGMPIMLGIIILVVVAIIIVVVIVVMRGKKEDEEEPAPVMPDEPMPEDPYMDEGMVEPEPMPEAAGLEPVPEPQALPEPEETPLELPPGSDGMEEPALAGEMDAPAVEQPEAEGPAETGGESTCPSCGFPVKPGWFLCPECKNPLS